MLYETSRHLYEKGNKLTIVSKDLEWPKGLSGSVLTELQQYLTAFFFGQASDSYDAGWKQFESLQGKEVHVIKDDTGTERRYYDMGLRCLWLEQGRYVSFLARLEERNETVLLRKSILISPLTLLIRSVNTEGCVQSDTYVAGC